MPGSMLLAAFLARAAYPPVEAAELEVPLEYVRYPDVEDSDSPFSHRGELPLECLAEPPAGDWKLPELVGPDPVFAVAQLAGSPRLFVFDRGEADAPFYDRLRCDTDGDGDLSDEEPIVETDGLGVPGYFTPDPVDLFLDIDGKPHPFSLKLALLHEELSFGEEVEEILVEDLLLTGLGNCGLRGSFELDGVTYRLLIAEEDINGRLDDVYALSPGVEQKDYRAYEVVGDFLFLTDEEKLDEYDVSVLGTQLALGGRVYDLSVDEGRGVLTLTPGAAATATVELPPGIERFCLSTEDSTGYLVYYRPGEAPHVPPGKYRLSGYQVYREDPQGDLWYLSAVATPRSPVLSLSAGESVEFPMGEPYVPEAIVPPESLEKYEKGNQDRLEVEFSISGAGHEIVNELRHVSGSSTAIELDEKREHPIEPRCRVMNTKGKIAWQGCFEYG